MFVPDAACRWYNYGRAPKKFSKVVFLPTRPAPDTQFIGKTSMILRSGTHTDPATSPKCEVFPHTNNIVSAEFAFSKNHKNPHLAPSPVSNGLQERPGQHRFFS